MQQRPLGRSGLTTAPLAFGGNVFGWTADEKTSFALLDAFVTFLRAERNLAPKTVDAYAMDVRDWLGELARRKIAVEAATRDDVLEHLAWLSRKGLAPRSRARHLAALRGHPLPIYPTKADTDASWLALVERACAAENARVEVHGVPGADLRPW